MSTHRPLQTGTNGARTAWLARSNDDHDGERWQAHRWSVAPARAAPLRVRSRTPSPQPFRPAAPPARPGSSVAASLQSAKADSREAEHETPEWLLSHELMRPVARTLDWTTRDDYAGARWVFKAEAADVVASIQTALRWTAEEAEMLRPTTRAPGSDRVQGLMALLKDKSSPYALHWDDDESMLLSVARLVTIIESDAPANTLRQEASNWRHWLAFCEQYRTSPWRKPMAHMSMDEADAENLIWAKALLFIHARMKPGRRSKTGQAKPASALAVIAGIRRAHKRMGRETIPLTLAAQLSHGMTRDFLAEYGPEALSTRRKEPYTNAMIRAMLTITEPVRVDSSCSIEWSSLLGISLRALVATLAQTGFRGDEVSLTTGRLFDKRCMTRWNVRWKIAGVWVFAPTPAQLLALTSEDYAVIIPPPSKADQFGTAWGSNPIYLRFSDTADINAARALRDLEFAWPVSNAARQSTPLFVTQNKRMFSRTQLAECVHAMLRDCGAVSSDRLGDFSLHSFRIYLACALLDRGYSEAAIMAALRWKTCEALKIYARMGDAGYADMIEAAATATITSTQAPNIPDFDGALKAQAWIAAKPTIDAAANKADMDDSVLLEGESDDDN